MRGHGGFILVAQISKRMPILLSSHPASLLVLHHNVELLPVAIIILDNCGNTIELALYIIVIDA